MRLTPIETELSDAFCGPQDRRGGNSLTVPKVRLLADQESRCRLLWIECWTMDAHA
jgi:hypothetical protein